MKRTEQADAGIVLGLQHGTVGQDGFQRGCGIIVTGTLAAGGLKPGVYALYEPPAPAGLADNPDRRAAGNAEIIGVEGHRGEPFAGSVPPGAPGAGSPGAGLPGAGSAGAAERAMASRPAVGAVGRGPNRRFSRGSTWAV